MTATQPRYLTPPGRLTPDGSRPVAPEITMAYGEPRICVDGQMVRDGAPSLVLVAAKHPTRGWIARVEYGNPGVGTVIVDGRLRAVGVGDHLRTGDSLDLPRDGWTLTGREVTESETWWDGRSSRGPSADPVDFNAKVTVVVVR